MADTDKLLAEKLLQNEEEVIRKGNVEKWNELNLYFYNPRKNEYFGKSPDNWGKEYNDMFFFGEDLLLQCS